MDCEVNLLLYKMDLEGNTLEARLQFRGFEHVLWGPVWCLGQKQVLNEWMN